MVGYGAATLCAVLASLNHSIERPFRRGWKQRVSVADAHRERWQADNELFTNVQAEAIGQLTALGFDTSRRKVNGEEHLLLLQGVNDQGTVSFGIRNSGTQAKTSLSLRLSPGIDPQPLEELLVRWQERLAAALT